jgi:hypothetical protein
MTKFIKNVINKTILGIFQNLCSWEQKNQIEIGFMMKEEEE